MMKVLNSKKSCWPMMLCAGYAYLIMGSTVHAEDAGQTSRQVEEIIVYATSARSATKTDAELMQIPQAISVITEEQFAEQGAVNFQDIFRYSAGVSTEEAGIDTRYDAFSARGFATVQYLDGLNRMPDFVYGARMEVFTIERAEILRGPSAVLYGAGGAGGLFNANSKTPRHEFGVEVGAQLGTDSRKQLMFDVTADAYKPGTETCCTPNSETLPLNYIKRKLHTQPP